MKVVTADVPHHSTEMRQGIHILFGHNRLIFKLIEKIVNNRSILDPPKCVRSLDKSLRNRLDILLWTCRKTEPEALVAILSSS